MHRRLAWPAVLLALIAAGAWWWHGRPDRLVVYCAHDSIFSEEILRAFEKEAGIPVAIRFDTEATKSLGLVELILRERAAPRCDVFWNNEPLGTMELAEAGALEPYQGPGWQRMPADFKEANGLWTGFAARLRVIIVNTELRDPVGLAMADLLDGSLSRTAIAKPLYGTTRFEYTVIWRKAGRDGLIAWHEELRERGIHELPGNAAVKNAVAEGECNFGFTDTDDFFAALDAGKPVAMRPMRLPMGEGPTICIPNTVSIVRGTKRRAQAERLVDYLLSQKTELALARSASRQIPLGPVGADQLPHEVRELLELARNHVPLAGLDAARKECVAWLKKEYAE